ncbi:unnamed protein product [Ectocarpus fasciculatus]
MLRFGYLGVTTTAMLLVVTSSASMAAVADGVLLYKPEQGLTPETRRQAQTARMLTTANNLQYDCAAHNISDEEAVEAFDNTTTLSLGLGIARILTGNRRAGGQEGTWYEDTLTNLLVEYCEEEERGVHHRYVTSQNATAAKDEYGICVQTLDGDQETYTAGLCERVANCYWEEPRDYLARGRRYTDEQYEANERAARDYMQSTMLSYGTLGFFLAVAVFAGCAKFAVRRGIYNKCVCDSDLQRDRTGYTDLEQKVPAAVYFCGLVTVVVAALLGLQGNNYISSGLDLMFINMDEAAEGVNDLASSVSLPLASFVGSLNASAEEVQLLLSSADEWIGQLEPGMLLRLDSDRFLGRGAEFDVLAERVEFASADFMSEAVDDLYMALEMLQVRMLMDTRLIEDFLDMTDRMEGQSLNVIAALALANETALENRDRFAYYRRWSDEYAGMRTAGVQGLVAAVGVSGAVGLLGVAAGLAKGKACSPCINLLRLTCAVTFTTTWAAFILSSLVIVGAVAWSDGCQFLNLAATRGWETAGLDGLSAAVLDGCLRGNAVTEELNITDALGFFEMYPGTAEEVGALNTTFAETDVETTIYAISDFVYSLNATAVAVSLLDFYTNAEVNGSLLLEPDCPYNVTFEGEEATAYLGRPWLALPTVATAAKIVTTGATSDGGDGGDAGNSSSSSSSSGSSNSSNSSSNSSSYDSAGNLTTISSPLTPWQAGGTRQSFGRQGGTYSAGAIAA